MTKSKSKTTTTQNKPTPHTKPTSHTKPKSHTKQKINIKNKKGGSPYSSDDYKDVGVLDGLKFNIDDFKTARGDLPPIPSCSIM